MLRSTLRVGLALASGGCIGVSWEIGALEGIRRATGFEAHHAERIVGTSAGAFVGGVAMTIGMPLTYAQTSGERAAGLDFSAADHALAGRMDRHLQGGLFTRFPLARLPRPWVGSVAGVRRVVSGGGRGLAVTAASLLPQGTLSTRKIGDVLRETCPTGWASDKLFISTFDMNTATPRILHAGHADGIGMADAVSASCAIPGMFAPVRLGARRLADGAIWSAAHLGALAGLGLDVVVCLHPLIGEASPGRGSLVERAAGAVESRLRARCVEQLEREKRMLEAEGTRVLVLEPDAAERDAMPANPMNMATRGEIMRRAARATERKVARGELGDVLARAAASAQWSLRSTRAGALAGAA